MTICATNDKQFFRNELKIDAFDLAIFTAIDIGYERVFKEKTSMGISMFINFNPEETYYEKFAITPFYRFYFFNNLEKGNNGYYFELFSKLASGKNIELINYNNQPNADYFDINLGASVGKKWIHEGGFVLEISLGGGRNLGLDKNSPEFAFRGGVSVGYRF
ncbi:MAG: hypothetical protein HC798_02325 [Polaribacter sp.]|nr:hypothetical protein [Polaribacter sp.]